MYKQKYEVVSSTEKYRFHYKKSAVLFAALYGYKKVRNMRTNKITYIVQKDEPCFECGKELKGKKYCSFCKAEHHPSPFIELPARRISSDFLQRCRYSWKRSRRIFGIVDMLNLFS